MNAGTANKFNVKFGLILNNVLGMNSPVTRMINVDMMVCINTIRKSFSIKLLKKRCSISSAISIPYMTRAILFPTNIVDMKLLELW